MTGLLLGALNCKAMKLLIILANCVQNLGLMCCSSYLCSGKLARLMGLAQMYCFFNALGLAASFYFCVMFRVDMCVMLSC